MTSILCHTRATRDKYRDREREREGGIALHLPNQIETCGAYYFILKTKWLNKLY